LPAYIVSCGAGNVITNNEFANFYGNGQMKQDVLSSVTNPKGGSISVTYAMVGNAGSGIRVLAASSTVTSDGLGNYATTTYAYSDGSWYSTVVRDRRFADFSPVTETEPNAIITTYYGQGDLAHIGRPIQTDVADLSGTLEQRTYDRWDTTTHGDSTFVGLGRQMTYDYGADGTHRDKSNRLYVFLNNR
jgi:hypothetical protein